MLAFEVRFRDNGQIFRKKFDASIQPYLVIVFGPSTNDVPPFLAVGRVINACIGTRSNYGWYQCAGPKPSFPVVYLLYQRDHRHE